MNKELDDDLMTEKLNELFSKQSSDESYTIGEEITWCEGIG